MARHANNFLGIQLEGPCPILVHVGVSKLGHGGVRIFAWVEWLKVHMRRWAQLKTIPACWLLQDLWLLNFCLWGFFCVGARYLFNLCIPFSFAFALLLGLGFAAVCFGTVFGVAPLGPLGQADALAVRPRTATATWSACPRTAAASNSGRSSRFCDGFWIARPRQHLFGSCFFWGFRGFCFCWGCFGFGLCLALGLGRQGLWCWSWLCCCLLLRSFTQCEKQTKHIT